MARRTASLNEPTLAAEGSGPAVGACCTSAPGALRAGSHSGRNVDTTKSTATATVAACAKMIQRRYIEKASIRNSSANLGVYRRIRRLFQHLSLESHTLRRPAHLAKSLPSP